MGKHTAPADGAEEPATQVLPVYHSRFPVRLLIFLSGLLAVLVMGGVWAFSGPSSPAAGGPTNPRWAVPLVIDTTSPPGGAALPESSAAAPSPSPSGPVPSPSPSPSPAGSSARPSPTPKATRTTGPPTPPATRLTARFQQVTSWPGAYQARYTITNNGTTASTGWTVVVTFAGSGSISVWDADASTGPNHRVTFKAKAYNATIQPGQSVSFGFNATGSPPPPPVACTLNGGPC